MGQDAPVVAAVEIVGGGPAGLMAAEVLAASGRGMAVTVHDAMPSMGRKLQLAGRGGLNLTHTEAIDAFLDRYAEARSVLEPAIRSFDPSALRGWSGGLGQRTVVGTSGRVFPEAFRATPLLRAWLRRLGDLGVELRTGHRWVGWDDDGALRFEGGASVARPDATVLALGGASRPRTGSDGAWVEAVRASGIAVAPLRPSNCGFTVEWTPAFAGRFGGVPLKTVRLSVADVSSRGDVMVTSSGIEGGAVYAVSKALREMVGRDGRAVVHIDLRPDLSTADLSARLRERRRQKDSLSSTLRRALGLTPVATALLREVVAGSPPTDPDALAVLVKDAPVVVTGPEPIERAISTAGGIRLDEIDERFMLMRRPGTFVAGEMLDWEAPTGGYLLQATFSTAVAAARGVLSFLAGRSL